MDAPRYSKYSRKKTNSQLDKYIQMYFPKGDFYFHIESLKNIELEW